MEASVSINSRFVHPEINLELDKDTAFELEIYSPDFDPDEEDNEIMFSIQEQHADVALYTFFINKKEAGLLGKLLTLYSEI